MNLLFALDFYLFLFLGYLLRQIKFALLFITLADFFLQLVFQVLYLFRIQKAFVGRL